MSNPAFVRPSRLTNLKCTKNVLKALKKVAQVDDTKELNMWDVTWILPHSLKIDLVQFENKNYAVHIRDSSGNIDVYRDSKTLKTAFGQAIVAYVKLCTASK